MERRCTVRQQFGSVRVWIDVDHHHLKDGSKEVHKSGREQTTSETWSFTQAQGSQSWQTTPPYGGTTKLSGVVSHRHRFLNKSIGFISFVNLPTKS